MNKQTNMDKTLKVMRRILFILISCLAVSVVSVSCDNDEVDSPVLTDAEYPRIFGRWPEKDKKGNLGEFSTALDKVLYINVQYTPSQYCEGVWYIDNVEVHRGVGFRFVPPAEGRFHVKLVVKTPKYETSREAIIKVGKPTQDP